MLFRRSQKYLLIPLGMARFNFFMSDTDTDIAT